MKILGDKTISERKGTEKKAEIPYKYISIHVKCKINLPATVIVNIQKASFPDPSVNV